MHAARAEIELSRGPHLISRDFWKALPGIRPFQPLLHEALTCSLRRLICCVSSACVQRFRSVSLEVVGSDALDELVELLDLFLILFAFDVDPCGVSG
jgi:hypothetical protein